MAEVIPFSDDQRSIVKMLEDALKDARTGKFTSLSIVYVSVENKIGNNIFCSERSGLLMGSSLMSAQHDFVAFHLSDAPPYVPPNPEAGVRH